ncbi:hypothetical protein C6W88_01665 [Halomonas litopenaei]|uniref:MacB-like periplasmic core domain-containing protein n=1 Tax=Halomonas litopenaei TaxID=2109328 RepID=A0ABX5J457_9GAMM|nr:MULTISPECIES: hypothetical protein [Halomonas]PTL92962.1 hypothetical protein C6W89_03490 [Halomonas sp. SYSU XM8]PTL96136.1 hypothetical protein C6W88_01665 [Halomonas litopenaei]
MLKTLTLFAASLTLSSLRHFRRSAVMAMLTFFILTSLATYLANFIALPMTFNISTRSEVLELTTVDTTSFYIDNGTVTSGRLFPDENDAPTTNTFRGLVEIGPNVHVSLTRVGNGPITLHVTPDQNRADRALPPLRVQSAPTDATSPDLPASTFPETATFRIDIDKAPFTGAIVGDRATVGRVSHHSDLFETLPTLREGRIDVIASSLLTDVRYNVLTIDLAIGDQAEIIDNRVGGGILGCVISATPSTPALDYSCRAIGSAVKISRIHTQPYTMKPTLWDYVKADPVLTSLLALLGTMMVVALQNLLGPRHEPSPPKTH